VDGRLHTFNYGKSVAATEEVIETEAVYHFSPGRRILSLGNIGCMMACRFCQNWQTSQVKHLDSRVVREYTPEQVIDLCLAHDIRMISWTYNDPVVWHEFVIDTSRLAQQAGIRTLYKSAFYIEERPVDELIECIDIFSVSLKSMNADLYRTMTKGDLEPMLRRVRQVYASERHLEISQLIIPQWNDGRTDFHNTVDWLLTHLDPSVPLHFVGFHPAYQYTHVDRTKIDVLLEARSMALQLGIQHCYLGNVYRDGVSDTKCSHCDAVLVRRYGLSSTLEGIDETGRCRHCQQPSPISHAFEARPDAIDADCIRKDPTDYLDYDWTSDVQSLHLEPADVLPAGTVCDVTVHHRGTAVVRQLRLDRHLERAIVSRVGATDRGVRISWSGHTPIRVLPVLDRAHFPVDEPSGLTVLPAATPARRSDVPLVALRSLS
jgi:pyruvate formate lyase activating enzyme